MKYTATSNKGQVFKFKAANDDDAKHYVINHCEVMDIYQLWTFISEPETYVELIGIINGLLVDLETAGCHEHVKAYYLMDVEAKRDWLSDENSDAWIKEARQLLADDAPKQISIYTGRSDAIPGNG